MDDSYIDAALERVEIIGHAGFVIYVTLCRQMDDDGIVRTTQRDIAGLTRMTIATVSRAVTLLRANGMLKMTRHKNDVTSYQIINNRNSTYYKASTTTLIDSINSSIDFIKNRNSTIDNLPNKNGLFDIADAQALITQLTSWVRVPGNPDDAMNVLGIVQDLHDKYKDDTLEYLRPFWMAFKERYPRSTHTFWLTDWAVQGTIPQTKAERKKEAIKGERFSEEH